MLAPVLNAAGVIGWFIEKRRAATARAEPGKPDGPRAEAIAASGAGALLSRLQRTNLAPAVNALEAAYRRAMKRWELLPDSEAHLTEALNRLTIIAATNPPKPAPRIEQYRDVGRESTRGELDNLAEAAEAVIKCVDVLHRPAILALADHGVMPARIVQSMRQIAAEAQAADVKAEFPPCWAGRGRRTISPMAWRRMSSVISKGSQGRTRSFPLDAARGARGLPQLVAGVFKAMGIIRANAKAAIKAVLAARAAE